MTCGRFNILIFLFALLLTSSCTSQQDTSDDQVIETMSDPVRFLALGDSYTIGQGVEEDQRWPVQLGEQLKENDFEVPVVNIIAQTGWTTNNLINAIENTELEDYNLVSLLIGVNNQFQSLPFEIFESEFDALLTIAINIAGSQEKVFVVSIPDYGVTPFGSGNSQTIAEELDAYNSYMALRCDDLEIPFINITEISRTLGDSPGALAPDNLHPSGSQYAAWTDEILPIVLQILEE